MAWTDPAGHVWTTGETVTAANMNTYIRLNLEATAVDKVTTAGDTVHATGSNALARLAIGSTDDVYKVAAGVPSWGPVNSGLVAADLLDDLIIYGIDEVASFTTSSSEQTVATVTLAIPAGWSSWRCWAMVTFGYNTFGVGSQHALIRIDGTDQQDQNLDSFTDFIVGQAVVAHRTGMTTTGNRNILFRSWHTNAGSGGVTDIALYAQAYRVS